MALVLEDRAADLEELKQLFSLAKRPRAQLLLQAEIEKLEQGVNGQAPLAVSSSTAQQAGNEEPMDIEDKEPKERKSPKNTVLKVEPMHRVPVAVETQYITLSTFSWDQESDKVKIYIFQEGASQDKTVANFKKDSFEIKFDDVNGKNYRCGVHKLNKTIIPAKCVVSVKSKRIVITLKKEEKTSWTDLVFKEDKFKPKAEDSKDPMAGIMDLMKNMYEEGDEETKRTIAKAWTESRAGKKPEPPMRGF